MKSLMRSILFGLLLNIVAIAVSAQPNPSHPPDWERIVEAAKKEGKVVVSIPASSELRAVIETHFEKRFGVDVEPVAATASAIVRRIVQESKAGVHYFDLHLGGSESVVNALLLRSI
jgi:iron(III) transport system substrate-binding protein